MKTIVAFLLGMATATALIISAVIAFGERIPCLCDMCGEDLDEEICDCEEGETSSKEV
jgi:hypothetical protein